MGDAAGIDAARGAAGGTLMMVTRPFLRSALTLLFFSALGCSGKTVPADRSASSPSSTGEDTRTAAALPPDIVEPGGTGPSYPGTGFVVHEWGTNTVVVGSDGSMQRGLHHEEEDLPAFVYDRTRSEIAADPTNVKMETPVTYFYSDKPLTATATVSFPKGIFTQWYPHVLGYSPTVLAGKGDPALDRDFPYSTAQCKEEFSRLHDGFLSWGEVSVLARSATPSAPEASLDRYTWSHARAVAANPVRITVDGNSQDERFLFYRGLGNFPLDVKITSDWNDTVTLANLDAKNRVGAAFVLRVEKDKAAFAVHAGGIAPSTSLTATAPPATQGLDAYVQDLAKAMVTELDKAGLYHDESIAMVKTWARQWFRTPGVRVLYLAPQTWTDAQIPLTIMPAPIQTVRVMVIRVEAITRVEEERDVAAVDLFASDGTTAQAVAHFDALGRFAEPRLRRALSLLGGPPPAAALAHLDSISGKDASLRAGE
jgi:hypothetical protein